MSSFSKELKTLFIRLQLFSADRKLAYFSLLFFLFLYPGQNYYQTLIIEPGEKKLYQIDAEKHDLYPVSDGTPPPSHTASSVVVKDAVTNTLLYAKDPSTLLLPASTTKIMTAIVALDYYSLDDVLTVQSEDRAIGSTMELVKNESLTVENLLYGLLVQSGNDATLALAENYPGGYAGFVLAMNKKAHELNLDSTVYKNPSGIESYGHLTTARDLAVLASYAMKNPVISRIVNTKTIVVTDLSKLIEHELVNTNELLDFQGVKGLKTGWTTNAGECLVTYVERNGHPIITVLLGSQARFEETKQIIDWTYNHHTWQLLSYE